MTIYIENVIISVAMITKRLLVTRRATMALESVLSHRDINSRGAAKNAVQAIYIKSGNTIMPELYAVGGRHTIMLYTRDI